jgi:hypothetical protein
LLLDHRYGFVRGRRERSHGRLNPFATDQAFHDPLGLGDLTKKLGSLNRRTVELDDQRPAKRLEPERPRFGRHPVNRGPVDPENLSAAVRNDVVSATRPLPEKGHFPENVTRPTDGDQALSLDAEAAFLDDPNAIGLVAGQA